MAALFIFQRPLSSINLWFDTRNGSAVNLFEDNTYVFIIRIWFEPSGREGEAQTWRGVIEHLPTGERRYFQRFDEIARIIRGYMRVALADPPERKSVFQWMSQFFARRKKKTR